MWKHSRVKLVLLLVIAILTTGCTRISFTTGLSKKEVARYEGIRFTTVEADILIAEQKYSYEKIFDNEVWNEQLNGTDLNTEEYVLQNVKELITSIIYLNAKADEMGIVLTTDEKDKIKKAAEKYHQNNNNISVSEIEGLYEMLIIAEKTFFAITANVDTEVSEDEMRVISIQYIFVSTMKKDEDNIIVSQDEKEKETSFKKIKGIMNKLKSGSDFMQMAIQYSEDKLYSAEIERGKYNRLVENTAYELEMGEVSDIIETDYGYYIIKCCNDNVEGKSENRKEDIILSRRNDIFMKEYVKFIEGKSIIFNEKYFEKINIKDMTAGSGELYEIYKKFFVSTQSK